MIEAIIAIETNNSDDIVFSQKRSVAAPYKIGIPDIIIGTHAGFTGRFIPISIHIRLIPKNIPPITVIGILLKISSSFSKVFPPLIFYKLNLKKLATIIIIPIKHILP